MKGSGLSKMQSLISGHFKHKRQSCPLKIRYWSAFQVNLLVAMMAKTFDKDLSQVHALCHALCSVQSVVSCCILCFFVSASKNRNTKVDVHLCQTCPADSQSRTLNLNPLLIFLPEAVWSKHVWAWGRFFPFAGRVLRFERNLSPADRRRFRTGIPGGWEILYPSI